MEHATRQKNALLKEVLTVDAAHPVTEFVALVSCNHN